MMLMTRRKHIEHADSWLGSSVLDSVDCSEIEEGNCMKLYLKTRQDRQVCQLPTGQPRKRTSSVLSMPGVRSACERLLSERGIALKVAMRLRVLKIS